MKKYSPINLGKVTAVAADALIAEENETISDALAHGSAAEETTLADKAQSIADAVFDALIADAATAAEMHLAMESGASLNLSYTEAVAPKPAQWVNVSVRRDRITGRPILFFYNQNTRGYWLECYDDKGQHAECAPSYMRKFEQCTHDNPHGLALVARWDALPGANGHKARPVTRLMPPRGRPYIGK